MFVDIMPEGPADDGIAYLNFYLEEDADTEAIPERCEGCTGGSGEALWISERQSITESQTEDKDWIK